MMEDESMTRQEWDTIPTCKPKYTPSSVESKVLWKEEWHELQNTAPNYVCNYCHHYYSCKYEDPGQR